ncbi:MAG TPA: putative Ig domain-containing protein [Steroidobacteraceae bacterium]
MRKSIGTWCVVAVTLLGLAGCGGEAASTATTGSTAAGTSGSTQTSTGSTTSGNSNSLQPSLISGSPPTIVGVGQAYVFRPTVSAPTAVTFHIAGKPSWAYFDSATGTLSGTPTSADVGVNIGVQITASNNTMTAALPAFEITVTSPASGSSGITTGSTSGSAATSSITLSWTEPTTDTDGSPLTNLASYIVYYGTASQAYTNTIVVSNPDELSYVVGSLVVGQTYYFAVKAVTSSGTQSGFSPEVSTTI